MRIWNPTQVDIADRATRLVGRVHISDPTVPATMAAVVVLDANPASLSINGVLAGSVPIATQGAGGVRVGAVGDGAPVRSMGVGSVLDADPYGTRTFTVFAVIAAGGAGQNPAVKLENPAASGKTLVVEKVVAVGSTVRPIVVSTGNVHEGGDAGAALGATLNRNVGNGQAPVALRHTIANSAAPGQFIWEWNPAIVSNPVSYDVPVRIPEGYGVSTYLLTSTAADTIGVNYAWREE